MPHLVSIVLPLLFYSLACVGAGALAMRFFAHRPKDASFIEITLAFLFGQGIFGSIFQLIALNGIFTLPVILSITAPLSAYGLWYLVKLSGGYSSAINQLYRKFIDAPLPWQMMAFFVAFILVAGGCSVASEITDDARAFYMVLPKVVAASHRLVPLPLYEDFSIVGLLAEMQLAALFLLGMPGGSPRLLCWLTALAGSTILVALSRSAGLGKRGQIIALSMLLTSSAAALLWGTGKTDFFAAAFGLGSYYYAFRSWNEDSRKDAVLLAGLFAGFAVVAKLSYLVAFVPGVCILLFWKEMQDFPQIWHSREQRLIFLRRSAVAGALFAVMMAITFIPQLTKNWMLYGEAFKTLGGDFNWFNSETTRRIVLTYPLVLTYGNFWAQFGTVSPLLLAFLPLLFIDTKYFLKSQIAALTIAAITGLVIWVVLFPAVPMPRYFLATLILLFVPASWAAERLSMLSRMSACLVWASTLLVLILFYRHWSGEIFLLRDAYRNFATEQMEGIPHGDEVSSYPVYQALNKIAEPGARVYTLTYFKFLMRPDLIQCATRSSERASSQDSINPEAFWRRIYTHGFTYILAEDSYNEATVDLIMKTKPAWVSLMPIAKQGPWGAYRIIFKNPPEKVLLTTREITPDAWDVLPVK